MSKFTTMLAAVFAASIAMATTAANAAVVEGSTSSAYGLHVRADLIDTNLINYTAPKTKAPDSTQSNPNSTSSSLVGPVRLPDDGSVVSDVSALRVQARRTTGALPTSHAEAHTAHVNLFEQAGVPLIKVNVIDAVADAKCTAPGQAAVSAAGSQLLGVTVGPQSFDVTPPANTIVPLVYTGDPSTIDDDLGLKVILNEQIGSAAGTGITVNMVHVIGYALANPSLAFVDLVVGHAQASVFCGNSTPASNNNNGDAGGPIVIDKIVTNTTSDAAGATDGSEATAHRGEEVTWKITIVNNGDEACGLVTVTDTLPQHFTFLRTSGAFGDAPAQDGQDVEWSNAAKWEIGPGKSLTQNVTAKVAADAPYGTYLNLVGLTGTCSEYSQGLRGPVTIIPKTVVQGSRQTLPSTEVGSLPRTGLADMTLMVLGMMVLLAAGLGLRSMKKI